MKTTFNSNQGKVQIAAVGAALQTLSEYDRTRITMACGVGKTYTQILLAEALIAADASISRRPRRILVLVPTLALIAQSQAEWTAEHKLGDRYDRICVCSNPDLLDAGIVQDTGEDAIHFSDDELVALGVEPGTTTARDVVRINSWLSQREAADPQAVSVIFTTYQSAPVVGQALKARTQGDRAFDYGIFDEAHKTAGISAGGKVNLFAHALHDSNIEIRKRAFFTATERVVVKRQSREDDDWSVTTMDDERLYGPRSFNISFREAAEKGIITPYKIIISRVDATLHDSISIQGGVVQDEEGRRHRALRIANMAAVQRSMEAHGLKKAITFHSRVSDAHTFATYEHGIEDAQLDGFRRLSISGDMSAAQRKAAMAVYATPNEPAVISNAKCLTEGVNVPATDMVAFIDPKSSKIDIVQSIGRALRSYPGKSFGYVLLPIHVSMQEGETPEAALDRAADDFGKIRDVMRALAETDDVLQATIRNISIEYGSGRDAEVPKSLLQTLPIEFEPSLNGTELARAIQVRLVEIFKYGWEEKLGRVLRFMSINDGKYPSQNADDIDERKLGQWCNKQRSEKSNLQSLEPERYARLNALEGFWKPLDFAWSLNLRKLQEYVSSNEGRFPSERDSNVEVARLGKWRNGQNTVRDVTQKREPERYAILDSIPDFWTKRLFEDDWETCYQSVVEYRLRNKNRLPYFLDKNEQIKRLGLWCKTNGSNKERLEKKYPERFALLNAIEGFWSTRQIGLGLSPAWKQKFDAVMVYVSAKNGRYPNEHDTNEENVKLARWCKKQRQQKDHLQKYELERFDLLNTLEGFWEPTAFAADRNFNAILEYVAANEGKLPSDRDENKETARLGRWCQNQNYYKDRLQKKYPERFTMLNAIPGFFFTEISDSENRQAESQTLFYPDDEDLAGDKSERPRSC